MLKKWGIWSSHSREMFAFGGKYLQVWGESYHFSSKTLWKFVKNSQGNIAFCPALVTSCAKTPCVRPGVLLCTLLESFVYITADYFYFLFFKQLPFCISTMACAYHNRRFNVPNQGLSQDWEFTSPKNIIKKGWALRSLFNK